MEKLDDLEGPGLIRSLYVCLACSLFTRKQETTMLMCSHLSSDGQTVVAVLDVRISLLKGERERYPTNEAATVSWKRRHTQSTNREDSTVVHRTLQYIKRCTPYLHVTTFLRRQAPVSIIIVECALCKYTLSFRKESLW